jgi:hypothetical protein
MCSRGEQRAVAALSMEYWTVDGGNSDGAVLGGGVDGWVRWMEQKAATGG